MSNPTPSVDTDLVKRLEADEADFTLLAARMREGPDPDEDCARGYEQYAKNAREAASRIKEMEAARDEALALHVPVITSDYADCSEESLRSLLRMRDRQIGYFRTFWVRDAKQAIAGDPRALRLRVEMAEAPPMNIVQSEALLSRANDGGEQRG